MQLRPYQQEAVDAIFREFAEHQSTLLVLPTGTGKTVVFSTVAHVWETGRVVIMAHREELIRQAAEKVHAITGDPVDIEMGEYRAPEGPDWLVPKAKVLVTSVQTMSRPGRLAKFDPHEFGLLITDECFPAGTLVDGRPIETIKVGDVVTAWDEATGQICTRQVTRLFRNPAPYQLMRIEAAGGIDIVSTFGHPYLTDRGWLYAFELRYGDRIATWKTDAPLHGMPAGLRSNQAATGHLESNWEATGVLFAAMQQSVLCPPLFRDDGENEQAGRLETDDRAEPYETGGCSGEGVGIYEGDGVQAGHPGWERKAHAGSATNTDGAAELVGAGVGCQDRHEAGIGVSAALQDRPGLPGDSVGRRSGRRIAREPDTESSGPEERGVLGWARVDSVAILQRGRDGAFGRVCPDGQVYNIEVEGCHTYIANGCIVHNCHHSTATTYRRVYEHYQQNPTLKHLGVTATPDRGDAEALGQIFETVAFEYAIPDAINDGWLVPIEQRYVKIEGLDFSKARTTAGDLNAGDLEQIMIAEKPLHGVADAVVRICENRQVIIFTVTVAHAERLAEILCRHRESSAVCLHGETETEERRRQLRRFKDRAYQYLVNCGLFLEGFDEPGIAAVAVARPTKSRSLYAQMIGRGTRPLPSLVDGIGESVRRVQTIEASLKPQLLVIDFVGNSGRHKLISTADILGGEYTLEALDAAKAEAESSGVNFLTRPKEIQAELDAEEERRKEEARIRKEEQRRRQQEAEIERRKKIVASAKFSQQVINPFDVYDLPPKREPPWLKGKPPTEKQLAYLEKRGIPTQGLTFHRASELVDNEIKRINSGKCSYKQAKLLGRFGYPADLSFSEASAIIDQLAKNGWKRPEKVGVAA